MKNPFCRWVITLSLLAVIEIPFLEDIFPHYRAVKEYSKNIWGISPLPVLTEEVGVGKRVKGEILT